MNPVAFDILLLLMLEFHSAEEDEGGRRPHKRKRPNIRRTWISPTAEAEWQRQQEIPDPEEPHPDDIVSEDSDYPEGGKDACTKD